MTFIETVPERDASGDLTEMYGADRESFGHVREIYRVFGAEDRVEQEVFPAEHSFWGKRGLPFLARHLA